MSKIYFVPELEEKRTLWSKDSLFTRRKEIKHWKML